MPARASQDPDRRGITQDGSVQRQLTLQAGLLRSQSRTVASSPAERKPSSCGWTSNERTLSPMSEWLRGIRDAPSRVGFKVADVPVLVHAVISDRVVFLCGCMDQVVRPVGEPRMRDSVFLRIERLELPARVSTRPVHTQRYTHLPLRQSHRQNMSSSPAVTHLSPTSSNARAVIWFEPWTASLNTFAGLYCCSAVSAACLPAAHHELGRQRDRDARRLCVLRGHLSRC